METMTDLGVTGILEMPPAGTLTGIAKRALTGVQTFALHPPDQPAPARALRPRPRGSPQVDPPPPRQPLVAQAAPTLRRATAAPDSRGAGRRSGNPSSVF